MKCLVSVLLALSLLFCFSVSSFAYTADELANKLYSGWTQTSSPVGFGGSWYAVVRSFLNNLDTNVSTLKTNSNSIISKLDNIINSYLHYIDTDTSNISSNSNSIVTSLGSSSYGSVTYQMSQIRTLLTTISNASSAWTSAQADTVTNKVGTIDTNITKSENWLHEIYNNSVTIDSSNSSLLLNSNDLKDGWYRFPQLQRPIEKVGYTSSWYFGVLQTLYNFRSDFSIARMPESVIVGASDVKFPKLTFANGIYAMLYRLQQVLANDDDLQMRIDTEENRSSFKDNFLDSSSDNSVKVSDITAVSNLSSGLKKNFDTGVNPLSLFDFLKDENPFSWFTDECKNSMVSVSSSSSRRAPAVSSPYGNYASEHMHDYYSRLEGVKKVD